MNSLYPFTLTRSVLDIPVGMLTLREKWERRGKDPKLQSDLSLNTIPLADLAVQ